jgi:hypothetical protein
MMLRARVTNQNAPTRLWFAKRGTQAPRRRRGPFGQLAARLNTGRLFHD